MPQRYFDPNSGEPLEPVGGQLGGASVNISDSGYGQLALPSEVGPVYHGFGAPPQQPRQLPASQPTMDIPETPKDTFFSGLAKTWDLGKAMGRGMLDPEVVAGTAAGLATAGRSTPFGMAASGAATGGVAAARELYKRSTDPEEMKKPLSASVAPVGTAFFTGALGEGAGRALSAAGRPVMTAQGQAAEGFFGRKNMMPQQMVDSAPLNFVANVAKHGPGGQAIIKEAEEKQSQQVLDHLMSVSDDLNPPGMGRAGGVSIDPATGEFNRGAAGKQVQRDIQSQLTDAKAKSGYPQFLSKYGNAAETKKVTDPLTGLTKDVKGTPVRELQSKRSDVLERSREAFKAGDLKTQSQMLSRAQKLEKGINKALPDQTARDEYRMIADRYRKEMDRLGNETVEHVREGASDDVIDDILSGNLKNYTPMDTKVGQTSTELLGRLEKALSPEAWQQMQADAVHRLGEKSIDPKTGMVSAAEMAKQLSKLDNPTRQKLFGKALGDLNATLSVVQQAQKFNESQAGRLFIAIRYGSAGIGLAQAALSGASAVAGSKTGHPVYGALGAGAVLLSPYAFAKLLTSEVGRTLLTKAASANVKTSAGQQAKRALTRWVSQNVMEAGREEMNSSPSEVAVPDELKNFGLDAIPEPPQ